MPRAKAPCGSYSAYKRHLRDGEPVDAACRQAQSDRSRAQSVQRRADEPSPQRETPREPAESSRTRQESLESNLGLIETAMTEVEASKLAPLSKRHSELLVELASLSGDVKERDPFDDFLNGDLSNVTRISAAKDREAS